MKIPPNAPDDLTGSARQLGHTAADGSDRRLTKDEGRVIRSGKEYDAEKEESWREDSR